MAYYVEVDEIDPELADLPIDLLHDHRAVHGPVDEVGEARADHVRQIILHLLLACCRDLWSSGNKNERKKEKREEENTERRKSSEEERKSGANSTGKWNRLNSGCAPAGELCLVSTRWIVKVFALRGEYRLENIDPVYPRVFHSREKQRIRVLSRGQKRVPIRTR